jgi:hypothetical protein
MIIQGFEVTEGFGDVFQFKHGRFLLAPVVGSGFGG